MHSMCLRTTFLILFCNTLPVEAARITIPGIAGIVIGSILGISLLVLYIVYMILNLGYGCAVCIEGCESRDKGPSVQPAPDQGPENQKETPETLP